MRVRMRFQMSGTRDGVAWPAPGGEIELSDGEAEMLLRNQMAESVDSQPAPEKTEDPKQEAPKGDAPVEAEPKKAPARRGRPRKAAPKAVDR